ncbi:BTB/POZ domain-containing protein [Capsicum annuum]|uniref:BTB/POZ domain-containing protein At5g48130 n=1 Tax=Capsicum annuum TaxID=4072 RepID=UPI0007BED912|nr:BTB/POZ domain-containing protein At5g48130 [Capsicum annuum]KAF3617374.1 BTB/POZ domain-containing protein [Capsicum annuum]KAF3637346.1 BTB/POZ domain-containing protein [Capsicum annuum]
MGTSSSPKDSSILSSPLSSPNVGALLKIKIISWSQETGFPVTIRVRIADRTFNLHKHPLFSKSGYFRRQLNESNEVELPGNFPGGPETFEMMALFIYGSSTLVDPFNVAALRCAAEFLEMTEEYSSANLCERFDIYLNQVVLQSWDDTLIVLQKCQMLLPSAEELLIVSRCIESLAFMACMEILDPESRRDHPVVTLEALASQPWNNETVKEILNQDLWIKDLIALPFPFFKRIISSLRRQGMKEKYISPIILFYANKWTLSRKTHQFWQNARKGGEDHNTDAENGDDNDTNEKVSKILQGILDLLPMGEKASKVIPVGFYFSLLSRSLQLGLRSESREKLQDQIASLLYLARVEDFLLPDSSNDSITSCIELSIMKSIFSKYVSFSMELTHTPSPRNYIIAELWDVYLTKIATDPQWSSKKFLELIETVPLSSRQTHDHLYRALNTFLMAHPDMSQEEKGLVCKYLNCQKLSQEVCIEAVQNELMPLRLIVQALFVQQLNTQQAFKECSDSFRYAHCGEYSGSLSSTIYPNSKSQNLVESPYMEGSEGCSKPLSLLKDSANHELSRKEYESTSFRIQSLEEELMSLKKTLQLQHISKQTETISKKVEPVSPNLKSMRPYGLEGRTPSKKRNTIGQVTSCIGSVNFSSQRRYATRLLKVFRRITLFGRGKPRKKQGGNGLRPKILNI